MILKSIFTVVVFAALAPLSMNLFGIHVSTPYFPCVLLFFLLLAYWIMNPRRIIKRREEYAFIAAQVLIVAFALQSIDPGESFSRSFVAVYVVGLYWISRYLLKSRVIDRYYLLTVAGYITAVLVVLATLQFVTKQSIGVVPSYFGENLIQGVSETAMGGVRVTGTFANANVFAQVIMIYSSVVLAYMLFLSRRRSFLLPFTFSLISISIIALSLSRSGILCVLTSHISMFWYWSLQGKRNKFERFTVLLLLAFGIAVSVLILVSFVDGELIPGFSRFTELDMEETTNSSRLDMYSSALQLLQNPRILLFGAGSGQYYESMAMYNIYIDYKSYIPYDENFGSVHNWPLLIATEHGVIVLLLYAYSLYKTVKRGLYMGNDNTRSGTMIAAIAISLASLYIAGFSFGTTGVSPWLLTPIIIIFTWIQNEYDLRCN